MLQLKPICENCSKPLPNNSNDAMICSYECTFCENCVNNILHNVCPNCGGGFERRPTRPSSLLKKDPMSQIFHHKPIDEVTFKIILEKNINIDPRDR